MGDYMQIIAVILGILLLPKVLSLLTPFIAGYFIYLICRKSVRRMSKMGINRTLAAVFSLSFAVLIIIGIFSVIFTIAYNESSRIPEIYAKLSTVKTSIPILERFFTEFKDEIVETLKSLSLKLFSYLQNITGFFMISLFSILSAFFFLKDEDKLVDIILQNGGDGFLKKVLGFKKIISMALSGYFKAQLILMSIIFVILSFFLVLFRVKYSVFIAFATALVDAIPVFGTGFILLPWAAYEFLTGTNSLGFGLIALYGVCTLTRQILEPKILSSKIGLPPLLTIFGVFLGYKLFGIIGLILGPVFTLIFVTYIQKRP